MKVYSDFDKLFDIKNPVLTIGTFDGVHAGHKKIIDRLHVEAEKIGGESVLFTFYPHPRMVITPEVNLQLIQTHEEKLAKLNRYGLKHAIVFPFTREFANTNARDFIENYLVKKLQVKKVVIGYDHHFGKNREGSIDLFRALAKENDYEVIEISALEINEINISSTKIRDAILSGDIDTANEYLLEKFELQGKVVYGQQLGNKIGFPTANLSVQDKNKIIPKDGVYAVETEINSISYRGMLNIGNRPTIDKNLSRSIELHIFDFQDNLYDSIISVKFVKRIRDEIKFDSLDDLVLQLKKDEIICRNLFNLVQ